MPAERKELFSEKVPAGSRTFFFDVKQSADGTKYLVISESRQTKEKHYEHKRVMVFEEHIEMFFNGFVKAVNFMEHPNKPVADDVQTIHPKYPHAYAKWSAEEDARLRSEYSLGRKMSELADSFQRQPGAISSRLKKLGLLQD